MRNPPPDQLDDTVDTVLATTGLANCQALYAEHTNTANAHLHIAIVRVDIAQGCAAGSKWLIEDLHQSLAILEERHGWKAEPNALYYARNGAVYDAKTRCFERQPNGEQRVISGSERLVRSADGLFISGRDRNALPPSLANSRADIISAWDEATSWAEFHQLLDAYQVTYRTKGSGARISAGDQSAKASEISPDLARKTLESAWGTFEAHPRDRIVGLDEYRARHAAQLKRLWRDRDLATSRLKDWSTDQIKQMTIRHVLVEQAIRRERDVAQPSVDASFNAAIAICTGHRLTDVDKWRAAGSPAEPPPVASPALLLPGAGSVERDWTPPDALRAVRKEDGTDYFDARDRLVFTDHGSVLVVHRPTDLPGLDEALKIAAQRWTTFQIRGSAEFQRQCAERAAVLNISLVDQAGQPLITPSRQVVQTPPVGMVADATIKETANVQSPARPDLHDWLHRFRVTPYQSHTSNSRTRGAPKPAAGLRHVSSRPMVQHHQRSALLLHDVPELVARRGRTDDPTLRRQGGSPGAATSATDLGNEPSAALAVPNLTPRAHTTTTARPITELPEESSPPVRPDHRDDPIRQLEIQDICKLLKGLPAIPTRRADRDDASSSLQIVIEEEQFDSEFDRNLKSELKHAAYFESNPVVQQLLEDECRGRFDRLLQYFVSAKIPLEKDAIIVAALDFVGDGRSVFLAYNDADFQDTIKRAAELQEQQVTLGNEAATEDEVVLQSDRETIQREVIRSDPPVPVAEDTDIYAKWKENQSARE